MSKPIKYVLGLLVLGLVAYNSVYFKRLDEVRAAGTSGKTKFDAARYAETFWTTKLLTAASRSAVALPTLLPLLKTDPEKAFTTYSQALGIGNIRYFLVKGEGTVSAIGENDVVVTLTTGEPVHLETEYIFGNAARDASGLIKITEFDRQASLNTTDLNSLSAALNDMIRRRVVPPLKANAKAGRRLSFMGAMELNRAHLHLETLRVIPIGVETL